MRAKPWTSLVFGLLVSFASYQTLNAQTNLPAAQANLEKEVTRWESILKDFQKLREESEPVLTDKKKSFEIAEQTVENMLTQIKKAIDEGKEGGPLLARIDEFVTANQSFINELGSAPLNEAVKGAKERAVARQKGLEAERAKVVETYNMMLVTARNLDDNKGVIIILKKGAALDEAYVVLKGLVDRYKEAGNQAIIVQNGLRTALSGPAQ
jgi:hypothetical protein